MSKLRTMGLLFASAGLGAGTMWAANAQTSGSRNDHADGAFQVARIQASWVFDRSDPRKLAGASDALMIVKVSRQLETDMLETGPQTYFDAEVIYSFKGAAKKSSVVKVAQESGYDSDSNTLYLFEGDPLLEVGRVYLVAGRMDQGRNAYVLMPGEGTQDVTDLSAADVAAYKKQYAKAVSNQIALPTDPGVS